jgi:C-terminal processing protease CtpA/Prc
MKRQFARLGGLGVVALLVFTLGPAQSAAAQGIQKPTPDSTAAYLQQADQAQREVQVVLANAQAEIARALQEVNGKVTAKVQKEIKAKLAAHRGAMLADLQARQAELAQLVQEKVTREIEPLVQVLQDSEGGWLGVQIAEVDAQKVKELKLPAERGVLITEVEKDSPADRAGLKVNDVVTEYNGQRLESATQFRRMVRESLTGRAAQLTVWRDGRAQTLSATLGSNRDRMENTFSLRAGQLMGPRDFNYSFAMPQMELFSTLRAPVLGISAEDISGQFGAYFGVPGGEGILVREVNSGSPAEKAGMKAGDVITKIDGEKVTSLEELREKLRGRGEQKSGGTTPSTVKTLNVGVLRKGAEVSLKVELEMPRPPERRRTISRRSAI